MRGCLRPEGAERSGTVGPVGACWYALLTRSRQEKKVHAGLAKVGLETYLPLQKKVHKWSDRKKVIEVPYFPGYIFVRCHEEERQNAWSVTGVVRYLGCNGHAIPIDDGEICRVRQALATCVPFEPYPHLAPGNTIVVTRGPLQGMSGVLVRKDRKYRLVVNIRAMGQGIAAELDASDVEPA